MGYNYCRTCGTSPHSPGRGTVRAGKWWQFWKRQTCPACGGDGYAKPPGSGSAPAIIVQPPPPPPPPPRKVRVPLGANDDRHYICLMGQLLLGEPLKQRYSAAAVHRAVQKLAQNLELIRELEAGDGMYYLTQEAAFCPGIVKDWPKVIHHPTDRHGRMVRRQWSKKPELAVTPSQTAR